MPFVCTADDENSQSAKEWWSYELGVNSPFFFDCKKLADQGDCVLTLLPDDDCYHHYYKSTDLSDTLQDRCCWGHFTKLQKYK